MSQTIRDNIWKVPRDIDFIIGIPRSGIICASIISEYLNCPLIDIDSFASGAKPTGGGRLRYWKPKHGDGEKKKVLVVDDTVFNGGSKKIAKEKLRPFMDEYEFVFLVVYLEGFAKGSIDIYLEDVSMYTNNFREAVLYEWNIFHHNEDTMLHCIYDIDGVLCVNPPDERNEKEYIDYIKDAKPLFIPTTTIGALCTYRLSKNQELTKEWLKKAGVSYRYLIMFNANSWDERNKSGISPEEMKSQFYMSQSWARLFVESDDHQAQCIFKNTGKPVYCVESNKLYS